MTSMRVCNSAQKGQSVLTTKFQQARKIFSLTLLAAAVGFLGGNAHAAAGTWNVDANGVWSLNTNWSSNIIADNSTATFTNDITADRTVSLDSARTITGLTFGDAATGTAASWILDNNGNAANTLTGIGTITVGTLGTGKSATISAVIAGSSAQLTTSGGTLVLSGGNTLNNNNFNNNTYAWRLNAGTVVIASDSAFGVTSGTGVAASTIVNLNGATLQASGSARTVTNPTWLSADTTVSGSESITFSGAFGGRGGNRILTCNITSPGTLSLTSDVNTKFDSGSLTLTFSGTGNTLISGNIRNAPASPTAGSIVKSGTGTLTLSGTNIYTGVTTVSGGTLLVNSPGSLHASSAVSVANTAILGGSGTINGTVSVTAGGTILLGASSATLTLAKSTAPTYNSSGSTYTTLKILASASTLDKVSASATTGNSVANVNLVIDTTGLSGNVSSTTIYSAGGAITGPFHSVTFKDGVSNGYTANLDYNTSGEIKLALTGSGGGTPTITTSGTLSAVNTTYGTASATPTSFTVSGANMTAGITVTPPAGFEVSQTAGGASGYAGSGTAITVGAAGTIASSTVYVRLAATATVGSSPYSGNITCVSSGATSQNIATTSSSVSKATPTATLAVNNSPVTYDGSAHAATVSITASSTPGAVANILTGGAANQIAAGTYAVTADFVPTDTANYNTLTAQGAGDFVILDANTYTVTFNNNGGSGTMTPQTGSSATPLTSNIFTKTGYTFAGWNTVNVGGGIAYADGASYDFTASTTLYAQWTINSYTVTFDNNTGSGTMTAQTGSSATPLTSNTFTKTGYTFAGWNTVAGGGGTSYANLANYTFTASTTLFAQWTINNYTVTFDNNGGSGTMTAQTGNYNTTAALTANTFAKTGYTFAGWNTVAGGGGTSYANLANYTFTASTTLYAQWTPTPTITLADTLAAVNTTYGTASATPTSFHVSGSALTGNLTVTPPSGYEVSLSSGSDYSTSLSITASGTLESTQVYVRLAATTGVVGSPYSGTITVSGGGASSQTIATASSTVAKADATVVVTPYSVTHDGFPHSATVTSITGVNGETGATVGTVTLNTTHTAVGIYASDSWTFTPTANYNSIGTTTTTINVTNGSFETPGEALGGPWFKVGSPWSITSSPSNYQVIQAVAGGTFTSTVTGGGTYIALINEDDCPITAPLVQNLNTSVTAGDVLSVTFYIGRPLGAAGGAGVVYFDVAGTKYTMAFDTSAMTAGDWQLTTLTKTITNSGNLTLGFYGTTGHAINAWIDNVSDVSRTSGSGTQTITDRIKPKGTMVSFFAD